MSIPIRKDSDIQFLVVHHTEHLDTPPGYQINADYIKDGKFGAPYDILINANGTVDITARWTRALTPDKYISGVQLRNITQYHIHHLSQAAEQYEYNLNSIHVAVVGNFDYKRPTASQASALVEVLLHLCEYYNLEPERCVVFHRDITTTSCPGHYLNTFVDPVRRVRARLKRPLGQYDAVFTPAGPTLGPPAPTYTTVSIIGGFMFEPSPGANANIDYLLISTDNWDTWSYIKNTGLTGTGVHAIMAVGGIDRDHFYVLQGASGTVFGYTSDGGVTWGQASFPIPSGWASSNALRVYMYDSGNTNGVAVGSCTRDCTDFGTQNGIVLWRWNGTAWNAERIWAPDGTTNGYTLTASSTCAYFSTDPITGGVCIWVIFSRSIPSITTTNEIWYSVDGGAVFNRSPNDENVSRAIGNLAQWPLVGDTLNPWTNAATGAGKMYFADFVRSLDSPNSYDVVNKWHRIAPQTNDFYDFDLVNGVTWEALGVPSGGPFGIQPLPHITGEQSGGVRRWSDWQYVSVSQRLLDSGVATGWDPVGTGVINADPFWVLPYVWGGGFIPYGHYTGITQAVALGKSIFQAIGASPDGNVVGVCSYHLCIDYPWVGATRLFYPTVHVYQTGYVAGATQLGITSGSVVSADGGGTFQSGKYPPYGSNSISSYYGTQSGLGYIPTLQLGVIDKDNCFVTYTYNQVISAAMVRSLAIMRSKDGTQSWELVMQGLLLYGICATGSANEYAYTVGEKGLIKKSLDSGQTFTVVRKNQQDAPDLYSVYFTTKDNGWTCGDGGTILRTVDGGANWNPEASSTVSKLLCITSKSSTIDPAGYVSYAGGVSGKFLSTINGVWFTQLFPVASNIDALSFVTDQIGWAVTASGAIYLTTDGGAAWGLQTSFVVTLYDVHALSNTNVWAVGSGGHIYHTTDGGVNWNPVSSPTAAALLAIDFSHDGTIGWIAGTGCILKTVDSGATWTLESTYSPSGINTYMKLKDIAVTSNNIATAAGTYLKTTTESGIVLHTLNQGGTWTSVGSTPVDATQITPKCVAVIRYLNPV